MIEISRSESGIISPMLANEPPGFVIALAALENPVSRVFVDDVSNPNCALLLSPTGWHTALGDFDSQMVKATNRIMVRPDVLVHSAAYGVHISRLAMVGAKFEIHATESGSIRKREMLILTARNDGLTHTQTDPQIKDLTLDSYDQASTFTPMLSLFWPDPHELIKKRMAKVFVENNAVIGICYSCFHCGDIHEPHITIEEKHRNRGIGTKLATAYANHIRSQNQRIFWSHYAENIGSGRCAAAAGFVPYGKTKVVQYVIKHGAPS